MKKVIMLIALCMNNFLLGLYGQIYTISMIKNGSTLLAKCCSLIAGKEIFHCHTRYSDKGNLAKLIERKGKIIMAIRDPRDRVVSFIEQVRQVFGGPIRKVPLPNLITHMLSNYETFQLKYLSRDITFKMLSDKYKDEVFDWIDYYDPDMFYLSHFEKLVGPKGGGSQEEQTDEIMKIADFMEVALTRDEAEAIGKRLFGGTVSFRRGTFGHWKRHFTDAQKELFKKDMGHYLIRLGYEKDNNW